MKIRHLPITDLARICVQPYDMQRHALKQVKGGGQGPNYNPTRGQFVGIVNRQPGVFRAARDPWAVVEKHIKKASRSVEEQEMNIPVAQQLYDYCEFEHVHATELDGYPISFSVGPKLLCWSPALFIYPDRITIPFLDLRRGRNLTREARRCIFSLQHHALRVNNPDYRDEVTLEVFQFNADEQRTIKVRAEDGMWLYSYDQLEQMITRTQLLWFDVLAGREEELKRRSGGRKGDLL
ncbi:hypothetical protein [Sphingomonas sp. PB4P5]|uniref:hypothetical protein n=1 Tax=Parasphingomonas puruogangriensis TaxID=3096155 RepID=UPI002FCB3AB9